MNRWRGLYAHTLIFNTLSKDILWCLNRGKITTVTKKYAVGRETEYYLSYHTPGGLENLNWCVDWCEKIFQNLLK
jgi:hypothetical protein